MQQNPHNEQATPAKEYYCTPDWFEVTQINQYVWAIREPYHTEDVLSYFIKGEIGSVLIDSGMGLADIRVILPGIPDGVFLTHSHWDHIGSACDFTHVFVPNHPYEIERIQKGWQPDEMVDFTTDNFDPSHIPQSDITKFNIHGIPTADVISDGDIIDLGNITIQAISTPGHTPGSMCFYIQELGFLFTGDTLYPGPEYLHLPESSVHAYINSLERLLDLTGSNLQIIFPGHNATNISKDLLLQHLAALHGDIQPMSKIEGCDTFGSYEKRQYLDFALLTPQEHT